MARGTHDRKAMREEIRSRTEESYRRKDKGGGFSKYFKTDEELPFWVPEVTKEDPHMIDIIPFLVGEHYPVDDRGKKLEKGSWAYYLDVWVHQNIGPNNSWFVCPAKNYNLSCPICEHIQQLQKKGVEYEEFKDIVAKRRNIYNIICYDSEKEEKKGIQIFEVSHHYMEKKLQKISKRPRGGGTVAYADPDEGMIVAFEVAKDDMKTIEGHQFIARKVGKDSYVISDEDLGKAFPLDEIIEVLSYEELSEIFYGTVEEEEKESKEEKNTEPPGRPEGRTRYGRGEKKEVPPQEDKMKCSLGYLPGVDIDKHDDCTRCPDDEYNACAKEKQRLQDEEKKEVSPPSGSRRRR